MDVKKVVSHFVTILKHHFPFHHYSSHLGELESIQKEVFYLILFSFSLRSDFTVFFR
jgi:hypothetical protein